MSTRKRKRKSLTDFRRLDAMRDEDIDLSDNPEMSAERLRAGVVRLAGRPLMGDERRQGIEVSLAPSDIQYARDLTGGNLSAALTMLIREHRKR